VTSLTIGTDEMLHPEDSRDGSGNVLPSGKAGNLCGSMVRNGGGFGAESAAVAAAAAAAAAAARFTTGVPPIDRKTRQMKRSSEVGILDGCNIFAAGE